jgi:hypothetical protein
LNINTIILHYENKPQRVVTELKVNEASEWASRNGTIPLPAGVQALWDTGADWCAISSDMAKRMNLTIAGTQDASGFGGQKNTPFYIVDITLPDDTHVYNVPTIAYEGSETHNFIIGMNVITRGDFSLTHEINGSRFCFTLI